MDTQQIRCFLRDDKLFYDVLPSDHLPDELPRPCTIIVNTDPADKPGEHWVAIYLKKRGRGRYFDSYGLKPFNHNILQFLKNMCPNGFKYNPVTLQTPNATSFTCGHYCVLFCMCMSNSISFEKFLKLFSRNSILNDIATQFVVERVDQSCFQ